MMSINTVSNAIIKGYSESVINDYIKDFLGDDSGVSKLNVLTEYGTTPLIEAIRRSRFGVVKMLIDYGADVNFTNKNNKSPLHYCCGNSTSKNRNNILIFDLLIKNNANIHHLNNEGKEPIHVISEKLIMHLLPKLIQLGANINSKTLKSEYSLLTIAVRNEFNTSTLKFIVDNGADVNSLDARHENILMQSIRYRNIMSFEKVVDIISLGVDLSLKNINGLTAYDLAKRENRHDVAEYIHKKTLSDSFDADSISTSPRRKSGMSI